MAAMDSLASKPLPAAAWLLRLMPWRTTYASAATEPMCSWRLLYEPLSARTQLSVSSHRTSRRFVVRLAVAAAATPLLGLPLTGSRSVRAQGGEVRIGFQKGSANLLVLKAEGALEERLGELGYTVTWNEFSSGPPLLEALNAGSIDFGATGAPPPIFAQAAGADLVYALASKPSPRTQAIIVPADSRIQTPADLAGKKVAVTKGSSANALLVRALRAGGLDWGDAEAVFLQPADAKAAFEGGSVDAWSIWDPYYAAEENDSGARTIATDESTGSPNRSFYLAARTFAVDHADALTTLGEALAKPISGLMTIPKRWPSSSREKPGWMRTFC